MSAQNRGARRKPNDFYPTPDWCVDELLVELKPGCLEGKTFLEPCRGNSVIYDKVKVLKPRIRIWRELTKGRDYLTTPTNYPDCAIITNPPFSLAQEFLDKSLREAQFVAYLLRINFLGGQCRHDWWQGLEPHHLYVLSRRPDFSGEGGDATEYAWFVWDNLDICIRKPGLHMIWNTRVNGNEK